MPVVYFGVHEFNPRGPKYIRVAGGDDESDKMVPEVQEQIFINKFYSFFCTINGTEKYVPNEEVMGWSLVKYKIGEDCYFVYPYDGKDSNYRDVVDLHL